MRAPRHEHRFCNPSVILSALLCGLGVAALAFSPMLSDGNLPVILVLGTMTALAGANLVLSLLRPSPPSRQLGMPTAGNGKDWSPLDLISDAVLIFTSEGKLLHANAASWRNLPVLQKHADFDSMLEQAVDKGSLAKARKIATRAFTVSGGHFHLAGSDKRHYSITIRIDDSGLRIVHVRDITRYHDRIARLQDIARRHSMIMRGANHGFWDWDVQKHEVYISGYGRHLLNLDPSRKLLPDDWTRSIHPDDRERRRQTMIAHLRGQNSHYECEYRVRDGQGGWRWIHDRGYGLRDRSGRVFRMAGSIGDITRRKNMEAENFRMMQEAEMANRAKTEFLANVSHELRTPLNAIIGFSEIITGEMFGPLDHPQYREYIRDIEESGRHLLELINDILDVSKAEVGKLEAQEGNVNIAKVIDSARRIVQERARSAELSLKVELDENLPVIWGDERKLKQMVLNLLSNAIKFTPPGGEVSIDIRHQGKNGLRISVADTGIGIAAEDIDTAMRPFGQIDSALSRKYVGTGLGLPLVKSLVQLHDGKMEIVSKPGHGTTVTITLPASRLRVKDESGNENGERQN